MRIVAKIGAIKNIDTLLKLIDEAIATGYPSIFQRILNPSKTLTKKNPLNDTKNFL
ncbi:MAG: hypothetical protein KAT16_01580 [Candidatus Heimdallarchaeota archaeon]|nr:hypothetical protein [Candidatus Heimdallarchaeota archaeon]